MIVYALIDINSFYWSCEAAFDPKIRDLPGLVLSNNDAAAVSVSRIAKKLGIRTGQPYFEIEELCKSRGVVVRSSNYPLYFDMFRRCNLIYQLFAPEIQSYSVDETFLNLTDLKESRLRHYAPDSVEFIRGHDYQAYGKALIGLLYKWTGLPACIGFGRNKTQAKMANKIAKRMPHLGGSCSLLSERIQDYYFAKFPVSDIWGIGSAKAPKLHKMGIRTALDLRDFDNYHLIQSELHKPTRETQDELRGLVCDPITTVGVKNKRILRSRSFSTPKYTLGEIKEALANFTHLAASEMRAQNSVTSKVEISFRTSHYREDQRHKAKASFKLNQATADSRLLTSIVCRMAEKVYKGGYAYKKAQVQLSDLKDSCEYQLSFFEGEQIRDSRALMKAVDKINRREGPYTVKSMACGSDKRSWDLTQRFLSKRCTTSFYELALSS